MSESPLKATLKAGKDYDAPWLTVDGATPAELEERLTAVANGGLIAALVGAANALKGANNAAPLLPQGQPAAPQEPVQQQQQAAPQPAWGNPQAAPPQWSQPPAAQQQQAPQQQAQPSRPGAILHPEGKTCDVCKATLEQKITGSGKVTWRCPSWRWNNGNPNEHTQIWG